MELDYNLLGTILLARKSINVFLRKASQLSKIDINKGVFDLADIIENHYIIRLADILKFTKVNSVTALTIKTWHTRIGYLGYKSLLKLPKLVKIIEIKELALTKSAADI